MRYFLIVTLLFVAMLYLAPIAATGVLVLSATSMIDRLSNYWLGPISTNLNDDALWRSHRNLLDHAALAGEASRNNTHLHIALINFKPFNNTDKTQRSAFINVSYDAKDLGSAANLIYTSGPLNLQIIGQRNDQRGKLAFEGRSPIRVTGLKQGFIAGVSFQGIDVFKASTSRSIYLERPHFCKSLKAWADFFELPLDQVEVWEVLLPAISGSLRATSGGFETDNGNVTHHSNASRICTHN